MKNNQLKIVLPGIVGLTMSLAIGFVGTRVLAGGASESTSVATSSHMDDTVSPSDIRDGVVNVIDPQQIQDLLVWARNSKTDLQDGLKQIDKLPRSERHAALKNLISGVIASSGDTSTELLMRSVLRRAILMDGYIDAATQSPEQETLSIELLDDSANWAIQLYPSDRNFLDQAQKVQKQSAIPVDLDFVDLGIQSGQYVLNHLWLTPSITARLVLAKESLSYFFNDLNRDNVGRRNPTIANVLMKIADFARTQGLTQTTPQYLQSVSSLDDVQKQNLARQIEAFYQDMIDQAKTAQINRGGGTIAGPGETDSGSTDSVLNAQFIYVQPGTFQMGSPTDEAGRDNDETQHAVTLTQGFDIQKSDVTQAQWYGIMGNNPSYFKSSQYCTDHRVMSDGVEMCPNNPVEQVSWNDVQDFISKLNIKEGTTIYRLPTEAEWEYAARGGNPANGAEVNQPYFFGTGTNLLGQYAWYSGNSGNQTHPVCTKTPNSLGLCDMAGNVWQWVQDWYGNYSSSDSTTDPAGPSSGSGRVLRGGSWYNYARDLRSAYRGGGGPGLRDSLVGFRLVRTSQ